MHQKIQDVIIISNKDGHPAFFHEHNGPSKLARDKKSAVDRIYTTS